MDLENSAKAAKSSPAPSPYCKENAPKQRYPLTDTQLSVWLRCSKNPGSLVYNLPFCLHIPPAAGLSPQTLREKLQQALDASPFLKTHILPCKGYPCFVRSDTLPYNIPLYEDGKESKEQIEARFVQPFALEEGPLFRFEIHVLEGETFLYMDVHHVLFDGSAIQLFLERLFLLCEGAEPPCEEIDGFAHCASLEEYKSSEAYRQAAQYFEDLLSEVEVNSALLADDLSGRPVAATNIYYETEFRAPGPLAQIESLKRDTGLSQTSFFLSAFLYSLAKMNGQKEALVCAVQNGRRDPLLSNTLSMMIQSLPVYAVLDEEQTSFAFIRQVQQQLFKTVDHGLFPFTELLSKYNLQLDNLFIYQKKLFGNLSINGHTVPLRRLPCLECITPFSLEIYWEGDCYRFLFEYQENLYSPETVRRFAQLYQMVVEGFLQNKPLRELPLCTAQQTALLQSYNQNRFEVDRSLSLVGLLRRQFEKTPDAPAVVYENTALSYRQLDAESEKLAGLLVAGGLQKGEAVGILLGRSHWFAVCTIGVMKAGGVCLPLDSAYPPERLGYMVQDAAVKRVITEKDLAGLLPGFAGQLIQVESLSQQPPASGPPLHIPTGDDPFCILYTSGSTSLPKGCVLRHNNLVNYCLSEHRYFALTPQDRVAAYASFSFDASMEDLYPSLTIGACVYILPEEILLDLPAIHSYFLQHKITRASMTTQLGRQYAQAYPENPHLLSLEVGGEKLVPCPLPHYPFYNSYGPTECTIDVTKHRVRAEEGIIPIGRAHGNCDIYIVDEYRRLLPPGAVGELMVAGYPVSAGYLGRPELTAEKFLQNPYAQGRQGYETLYATGDICCYQPEGLLRYVGRRDEQVKIRGFRIELSEIEKTIGGFEEVAESCVVAKELPIGKALVAYLVWRGEENLPALKAFIAQSLPPYMVPSFFVALSALPLTPNGKVDKRALPEPCAPVEDETRPAAPLSYLQTRLQVLAGELLGQGNTPLNESLVSLGLSSLSAMVLASRLGEEFGLNLPVARLLGDVTLLKLEEEIVQSLLAARAAPPPAEKEAPSPLAAGRYPLSYSQQGVYLETMKHPEGTVYNIPLCYTFPPAVDAQRLARAAEAAISAHSTLFVQLEMDGEGVWQTLHKEWPVQLPVHEMDEEEAAAFCGSFTQPFNLFRGPLWRGAILATPSATRLVMDIHHLVMDGFSYQVLMQDLRTAYEGGVPAEETHSFFTLLQEEQAKDKTQAENYYTRLFEGVETASRPAPSFTPGQKEEGLGRASLMCNGQQIQAFCKHWALTPAQLYLASCLYTVARFAAHGRPAISLVHSGREEVRYLGSVGMFVKTLPLALSLAPQNSRLAFMQQAGAAMAEAVKHSHYPITEAFHRSGFAPSVNFVCQLGLFKPLSLQGCPAKVQPLAEEKPKFDLSLHVTEEDTGHLVQALYNTAVYSPACMESFTEALGAALAGLMEEPEAALGSLSLVLQSGLLDMQSALQGQGAEVQPATFHGLFEQRAECQPQHPALYACDAEYSYGALNQEMNRIAHALMEKGLQKGERVLLLLPRTSRFILAQYGVLKAGGVYIPCDVHYPKERIAHIAADSDARFILCTAEWAAHFENALEIEALLQNPNTQNPALPLTYEDSAYILYTSGSTGRPKGVEIRHGGIANYLFCHPGNRHVYAAATQGSTLVSVTTATFDMSLKETALALCSGLRLVLATEEEASNPPLLAALMKRQGCDVFNATPSRMEQYLSLPAFCEALAGCKVVMCGGEGYPAGLLQKLQGLCTARLFNTYGPTEITVSSHAKELTEENEISIGQPLLNVAARVLDAEGNLLPPYAKGELYIGGAGVAKGYLGNPALTQKSFVTLQNARFYKTGDYALCNAANDLAILGRMDGQLKLNGLRIEPGEIEKVLLENPAVTAATAGICRVSGIENLCAWYTAKTELDAEELRAQLSAKLADYMVPRHFVYLPALPLTPNGKLNRKALPAPLPMQGRRILPAKNQAEATLMAIYEEILHTPCGADDSFFALGGSSLLVTKLIVEANRGGLQLSYGDVFLHKTPRALARLALQEEAEASDGLEAVESPAPGLGRAEGRFGALLSQNTLANFYSGEKLPLGNLLLTGVTGYLGIHLLQEFLQQHSGQVYCLLRPAKGLSAVKRLKNRLFYYFEDTYEALFGRRIHVVEGDVTSPGWTAALNGLAIDTVLNSAAMVRHFSEGHDIEDVNVGGTKELVAYCQKSGARLLHISTTSVAGVQVNGVPALHQPFTEHSFDIGQNIDNQYVKSKFLAEQAVFQAAEDGLCAKIFRVGNLSPRQDDGEFQMNYATNGFLGRLRAYAVIGAFPYSAMELPVRMSPVESTAKAILLLAASPRENCVFHPFNNHVVPMGDIIREMMARGLPLQLVEDDRFAELLAKAEQDAEKTKKLTTLLAYETMQTGKRIENIPCQNQLSLQMLHRLGFFWPSTSEGYISEFLQMLQGLNFFD